MRRYTVGVPFVLLVFLLSPLAILAPVAFVACMVVGVDPIEAFRLLWRVLTALRGTDVEVSKRNRSVLVHIS
ncbi:MAG TPA: hypothetical protein VMB03_00010 [Bryobacteraceae bacterium]|nr:hypothetical protein [Bryobacteraceae bacterium]